MQELNRLIESMPDKDVEIKERKNGSVDIVISSGRKKAPRLHANKNGKGYLTSYTLTIGCAEARDLGFIDADGNPLELEKFIDTDNKSLIVKVKS